MVKTLIGASLGTLVATAGLVVGAPAASAATTINCTTTGVNTVAITVTAGSTESFTFTGNCANLTSQQYPTGAAMRGSIYATTNTYFAAGGGFTANNPPTNTQWTFPANQSNSIQGTFPSDRITSVVYTAPSTAGTDYFYFIGDLGTKIASVVVTVSANSTPDSDLPAVNNTPQPWLQAYGRHEGASCLAGWHPSWAEWAVDKTGGWTCERTVLWNGSTWVQNPNAVWGTYDASLNSPWSTD